MQGQHQFEWASQTGDRYRSLPDTALELHLQRALMTADAPQGDPVERADDWTWLRQVTATDHIAVPVLVAGARVLSRAARGKPSNGFKPVVALHADPACACLPILVLLAWMLCGVGMNAAVVGSRFSRGALDAGDVFAAMGVSAVADAAQLESAFVRGDPAFVPLASINPNLDAWLRSPSTDACHRLARALTPWADPIGAPADLRVLMTTDEAWAQSCLNVAQAEGLQALILQTDARSGVSVSPAAPTRACLVLEGRLIALPAVGDGFDAGRSAPGPDADAVQMARWVQSILAGEFPVPRQAEQLVDLVTDAVGRTVERTA